LADDWGWPHASAYGDQAVKTPNFDRLAREGVLFHHVYTTSPSCTPSRNALITGKYHWQLGSGANLWSTLPVEHNSFVHLLRDRGYAIGRNRDKTWGPGNIKPWIAKHGEHPAGPTYKNLDEFLQQTAAGTDKPFCFWLGTSDPHRPYQQGSGAASGIDPSKVQLFPHFPDTPKIREDVADYYFEVQRWDNLVGSALKLLEEKGMLDNTIVLMTGDHGMPFPRGKGHLYDSGVRVPLAVRWGEAIKPNRQIEDFVSFADFAPTLLEAAGVPVPKEMTGRSFANLLRSAESGVLAPQERPHIVFGRERHVPAQEAPNLGGYPSRGLRTHQLLYIRNYQPDWWPAGTGDQSRTNLPRQWYADCDGGPVKDYIIENKDKDEAHQRAYALCFDKRPAEELYDLGKDPGQIHNVAAEPQYAEQLARYRALLQQELTALHDPRAKEPGYTGFDGYPYLGGGGGKK
jgi:arylsulfatase A-like enzyme